MSLDYGFTCPDIDKNIDSARETLYDFILETYRELNPLLEGLSDNELPVCVREKAKEDAGYLYESLEDIFENVRSVNEDMRRSADKQISDLKDEISELEHELRARDE